MIKKYFKNLTATFVIAAALLSLQSASATVFNDLTTGGTVTINDGIFSTSDFHTAGTGVIQPFVRIDGHSDTSEAGYNTSTGVPLNVLSGAWNSDLLVSSLVPTTVNNTSYYVFRLDLNEPKSGNFEGITLNQVQIFGRSAPALATGVTVDSTTGRAIEDGTDPLGTLLWDMNPAGDTMNSILLSYAFRSGGSGTGDMELLVPTSVFDGQKYVVMYSQFGADPIAGGQSGDAGFEEWTAIQGEVTTSIPEPSTIIAGALLLLPLGVSAVRVLRKSRAV